MRKIWKGLVLGAIVGGAVKVAQEVQGEAPIEEVGPVVAKAAGQAALAGAAVGFLLDRRDRRKMSKRQKAKAKAGIGTMVAGASALADVAIPALQQAAKAAKPKIEHAADVAKPVMKAAAVTAKEKSSEAAKAAKPHVEHATDLAKARAQKVGDAAKAKLSELDTPVLVAV